MVRSAIRLAVLLSACRLVMTSTPECFAQPAGSEVGLAADQRAAVFGEPLRWTSSAALLEPVSDDAHQLVSIKDPTVVYHEGRWHVYATTANSQGHWSIVYV
ncbi:MAG: hypothetical protein KDA61_18265, partial [Planctomycetales bacterium]|nr:hypothetical protein [Planctomycetales bacterium]